MLVVVQPEFFQIEQGAAVTVVSRLASSVIFVSWLISTMYLFERLRFSSQTYFSNIDCLTGCFLNVRVHNTTRVKIQISRMSVYQNVFISCDTLIQLHGKSYLMRKWTLKNTQCRIRWLQFNFFYLRIFFIS